jgi:hypothetical protein
MMDKLRLIPYYTGKETLEEILRDKRAINILWLEILFNDSIDWESLLDNKEIKEAYEKACIWYCNFKTLIESNTHRKPLKKIKGKVDSKEYRRFLEALHFVSA